MTILITGVAGFIGMHSAIKFLDNGWNVIGIDNLNDYYDIELKKARIAEIKSNININEGKVEFEFHKADINSRIFEIFRNRDIEVLLHLAAQAGVRYSIANPQKYLESNILGFQNILEFVRKKQKCQFIYASSSSVYGKRESSPFKESDECNSPESYYAFTKIANELMAKSYYKIYGISSVGLRFFTVYGPWGRPDMAPMLFLKAAYGSEPIQVFNHGQQKRDFTYIDDIVGGIYKIVLSKISESTCEIYNIGNGGPTELMHFIECVESVSGCKMKKEFIEAQNGDVTLTYASLSKIYDAIGYEPKVDLKTGIERLNTWFKEYYHNKSDDGSC